MEQNRNNIFTKSDDEIIRILARYWKMSEEELMKPFKVIASFKKADKKDVNNREYGFFEDVRNLNGDILYYPKGYGLVKIFSVYKTDYSSRDTLQIYVKLASRSQREKHRNPFLLNVDVSHEVEIPDIQFVDKLNKEKLIKKIFDETGSTIRDAKNTANALHAIMGDLYTETERFVFELLQNADDQPEDGELVNVKLKALDENLLFLHTGKPFTEADVESISSIGDSTKRKDTEKTGYKGIGFKSVFSDAETVYIDSGNFSFAFDKNSPLYLAEANMDEIPWQIKPIWEERYRLPKEVQKEDLFFYSPVGIALSVGREKIATYNTIIPDLLSEPRFTLFLRNVGNIFFENNNGTSIIISKKTEENGIVQIESNDVKEKWITRDYIVEIPKETIDAIQNEKLVPTKLKEATKTKITFAAKIVDDTITPLDNAVLFTYLPTKVNDFGFKFLVNADFLTTASRESIHFKNVWNRFLFQQIGGLLLDWIKSLSDYKGSLTLLPDSFESEDNILMEDFKTELKASLERTAFIKGHNGGVLSLKDIMLDKSAFSLVVGKDLFCQIINPLKSLPYDEIDDKYLRKSSLFGNIEEYTSLTVLKKVINHSLFNRWIDVSNKEQKNTLYGWLKFIDNEKTKPSIMALVDTLPIYKFGERYLYKKDVNDSLDKIVIDNGHRALVPIYEACEIECSENIDTLPIACFYSDSIIKSTFEYIFSHLKNNENFVKWIHTASDSERKILTDWLDEQDSTPQRHKILADFVAELPVIVFNDKIFSRNELIKRVTKIVPTGYNKITTEEVDELDKSRLIITNKLFPIVDLLIKIGFQCSANIEKSPYIKYFNLPKELDLFNLIKEKANLALKENENALSATDKLSLFKALKDLDGVNDTNLAQILLFGNEAHTHRRWLSTMTSYSPDVPTWISEYTIRESENFHELQEYLVKKDCIFEDIVKKNINEITQVTTLKEVYLRFKDSWTIEFTKSLINKLGTTDDVLDMVELQGAESKKFFLQKTERIDLDLDSVCSPNTRIYRLLSLAFQVFTDDELHSFAGKIWIGQRTLSSFMVSDEVSFEYHEGKRINLPLNKLLPNYSDTGIVQKLKNCLSTFDTTLRDRLLSLKPMGTLEVMRKIDMTHGYTPYSYLLGIYRARKVHNYYLNLVPYVDLAGQSYAWVAELLTILFSQKVELYNDCYGYRLSNYFAGYFSNEFINDNEKILKSIEDWADTEDKRSYLIGLGVKTERTKLIQARKALVNNEVINDNEIDVLKEHVSSTILLVKSKGLLPFKGTNQIISMCKLELALKNKVIKSQIDLSKLSQNSIEYDLPEYLAWKDTSSFTIFLHEGKMPYQLLKKDDGNLLICSYNIDDYHYDTINKTLYINKNCEIRDILYSVVSNSSIPFSAKDWQQLYYYNLVAKNEVETRDQEIEQLKRELQEYKNAFGELSKNKDITKPDNQTKPNDKDKEQNKKEDTKQQETSDKQKDEDPTIKKGKGQEIPKSEQISAQLEAQKYLMEEMPYWHFPPHYGEYNSEEGKPYHFSTVEVKDHQNNPILIVLKSYKKQDEPFKINPAEWESIIKDSAYLFIYTGDDIKRITKEDLVKNQSNISLSFSTKNLDIEDRISAFCSSLHYFKELHFDFKSFNLSESAESIKNIFKKNEGTQNSNTENDI